MESLLAALLIWIEKNSNYDATAMHTPVVIELTAQEMTREAYKNEPHLIPDSGVDRRVLALYSWDQAETSTIFILEASTTEGLQLGEQPFDNPVFQERLLHELVHHAQYSAGAYDRFPCKRFGEKEAYQLGGLFLKQRHAADPLPNRQLLAHMYSRC